MSRNDHCPERLLTYLDGELPPAEAEGLSRHIADCLECQRTLGLLQRVESALGAEPLPVLPPGFATRVVAQARSAHRHPAPLWWVAVPRGWRAALAASFLAALAGGILLGRAVSPVPPTPSPVVQMARALDNPVLTALAPVETAEGVHP